jgi:hypothetical protein
MNELANEQASPPDMSWLRNAQLYTKSRHDSLQVKKIISTSALSVDAITCKGSIT